jgi:protein SCO1/2
MRFARSVFGVCLAILLVGVISGLAGCNKSSSGAPKLQLKTYHLRGRIVAVSADGHLTVDAGPIPGYMEAMTMSYKLVDPTVASELHVGDVITANVLVEEDAAGPLSPKLDKIVVVGQAKPDTRPTVQYHVPAQGEAVPDFKLLNQSGKSIHLAQFRGKAVLLTFIYTRCPLADFCPKMSSNFSEIDKGLANDKSIYSRTHLLSVSFDPEYDTPKVLRSYGGAHTGKFTKEDFSHWDFAAPSIAELPKMEEWFDVGVTGSSLNPTSMEHSLSTVLIGKDGKVIAWYPTNDWKVADVLAEVQKAAA